MKYIELIVNFNRHGTGPILDTNYWYADLKFTPYRAYHKK